MDFLTFLFASKFLAVIISMASSCLTICALSMVLGDLAASFILPNEPGRQWVKVGYLNMSDPTQQCPYPWQTVWSPTGASCEKKDSALCDSVNITTSGASYQKVCGSFLGYQIGSPDAFNSMRIVGLRWDIEKYYVDGVSITYGSPGNRQHVYTYAAGGTEYNSPDSCPCTGGASTPEFVGSDYSRAAIQHRSHGFAKRFLTPSLRAWKLGYVWMKLLTTKMWPSNFIY